MTETLTPKRPRGRPMRGEVPMTALERANVSKGRRAAAGLAEVRYYVTPETRDRAKALARAWGLPGVGELIERLVSEALQREPPKPTTARRGSPRRKSES